MATLYIDFEQGNDNYGGTSFALLASGTNGRITSTTFSASGANFPNDGSLINQYLSIFNGTIYAIYQITSWINSTSLTIAALSGGTALANQAVDRQYFIGGRWQTLTNGATAVRIIPGDTIRVEASPDPTSLGINGIWTSSPLQPTKNISSSTNASPIVITSNTHGYSNGDTVVITGHAINTNANGTWEIANVTTNTFSLVGSIGNGAGATTGTVRLRNNSVVKLASVVTANIASCGNRGQGRASWITADAVNNTVTQNTTDFKEGDCSDSIAIGINFTTGRAAYVATGNLNLSGYQQVSFWIKQTAGTVTIAGDISLRLCSDTAGVTTVNTISIPALGALNIWQPVTVDLGSNLGSSIQSIVLYVDTDRGAVTFLLSNIIACKASSSPDSLSLISLIGKNINNEPWVAIQSINGTRVFLDGIISNIPITTTLMGYYGTSETVTIYKRETIPIYSSQTMNESGGAGARFILSGGWDRTSMSTQTSDTYLDGRRGNLTLITTTPAAFWTFTKINFFRFGAIMNSAGGGGGSCQYISIKDINHNSIFLSLAGTSENVVISGINNMSFNNNITSFAANGFYTGGNWQIINIDNVNSNSSSCFGFTNAYYTVMSGISNINNNASIPISCSTNSFPIITNITNMNYNGTRGALNFTNVGNGLISNITNIIGTTAALAANTQTSAMNFTSCDSCKVSNITNIAGSTTAAITCAGSIDTKITNIVTTGNAAAISLDFGTAYIANSNLNDSTLVASAGFLSNRNGVVYIQKLNNNNNNHQTYVGGGVIASNTSIRNTPSGISWSLAPTSTLRNSIYPLSLSLAKILVFANKLVMIKGMLNRNNTGLTLQLKVQGNQISGVNNDIVSSITATANTWQEVTLAFTPTETGVIELLGEAYGGTTFTGYIDDLTITQAP